MQLSHNDQLLFYFLLNLMSTSSSLYETEQHTFVVMLSL